jgi:DNA-binding response OmpR family regulator
LLIEDDAEMAALIADYLARFGHTARIAPTPAKALELLQKRPIDLAILDLSLPQMDGLELLPRIKAAGDIPVIISTARGDLGNKIAGFEAGADDYLAKPYEPRELILRVDALLRRSGKSGAIEAGPFRIEKGALFMDGEPVELTPTELAIFTALARERGRPLSRDQLIHAAGLPPHTRHRTIDTHIYSIRQKIGDDPKHPTYIKSVWGMGYKLL